MAVEAFRQIGARGGDDDQPVDVASGQRFDAVLLLLPRAANAKQQLPGVVVDDRFDLIEQLRAEGFRGAGNDQSDGFGGVAAQGTGRVVDGVAELFGRRAHASGDVVVFGAFAGKHARDGGDGHIRQRRDIGDRAGAVVSSRHVGSFPS